MQNKLMYGLILSLLLVICSCTKYNKKEIPKPKNYIEQENFIKIMADVRLVESAISYKVSFGANNKELTRYYYNSVFSKYKITPKQFEDNFKYYASQPEEMNVINEKTVEYLMAQDTTGAVK